MGFLDHLRAAFEGEKVKLSWPPFQVSTPAVFERCSK